MEPPTTARPLSPSRQPVSTARGRGWLSEVKRTVYAWSERWGDWRLGIDTRGFEIPADFGADAEGCHSYLGLSYPALHRLLRHAPLRGDGGDVFVDIGSGLGRVVLQAAATLPLARAIGLEYSPGLHRRAQANLERARSRLRCREVQLVQGDARHYAIPDDASLVFFFMPFSAEILGPVLDGIRRSLQVAPRPLTILYVYPTDGAVPLHVMVAQRPWLRLRMERDVSSRLHLVLATIDA